MVGHKDIWRTRPDGVLACRAGDYRLLVEPPEQVGGSVRYQVLRRDGDGDREALIGSGTAEDLRAAMKAAVEIVERLTGTERLPLRQVI